ncbi:MAG: SRPBCC family protein [Reichenbachiella sp.]|uniref:SRPBCC family protein n=1 Tax=Reichenbachiella sp. TaxID=2184521 RepID=UPI0032652698
MKIKGSIVIAKDRATVVKLFADPKYNKEYQDGFMSKELISGTQGQDGAVSKIFFEHNGREMVLTETITSNQLPDTYEAFFHHEHMDNTMKCNFVSLDENSTRYEYEYEYTRINWVMPRLMAILFPGMYRKPAEKWLNQFKLFVEKQ